MFLLLRPQNHSAPVKIAQRNQGQRAVSFFVFCHSSGSARKALASEVVEQDGSAGIEARVEKGKSGQDWSEKIRIQAYQGEAFILQADGCVRKISLPDHGLFAEGKTG